MAAAGRKRLAVVGDRIEAAEAVVDAAAAAGIPVMRAREAEVEAAAEMARSAAGKGLESVDEGPKEEARGRRRRRRAMRCRLGHQFRELYLWEAQRVEGRFAGLVVVVVVDAAAAADAVVAAAAAGRDTDGLQRSTLQPRPHLAAATSGARTSWACASANRGLTRQKDQS